MEIKIVLQDEISKGLVDWIKLEPKIAAVVEILKHTTTAVFEDGKSVQTADNVTFKINSMLNCIKLIGLRLKSGKYHCKGIQRGFYYFGKPIFKESPIMFGEF